MSPHLRRLVFCQGGRDEVLLREAGGAAGAVNTRQRRWEHKTKAVGAQDKGGGNTRQRRWEHKTKAVVPLPAGHRSTGACPGPAPGRGTAARTAVSLLVDIVRTCTHVRARTGAGRRRRRRERKAVPFGGSGRQPRHGWKGRRLARAAARACSSSSSLVSVCSPPPGPPSACSCSRDSP